MDILRSSLIALSQSKALQTFTEKSRLARRISGRFVAGTSLEDVLLVGRELNDLGVAVTFDALGENVRTATEAEAAAAIYHRLLDAIAAGLDANISVKLTQMGMDLGDGIAERIVGKLVEHACKCRTFVRVDMEGSSYTDATLALVRRLHAVPDNSACVGVVVQAYLYRTEADVHQLLLESIRMRLCKGAYLEPPAIAFASKAETDRSYVSLAKEMLQSGIFHGLATHDEAIIAEIKSFVAEKNIEKESFEFQMLYGIRRDLQASLVNEGYRVRVYVPFGPEWYPYFMRRLAERPANMFFLLKNLFR